VGVSVQLKVWRRKEAGGKFSDIGAGGARPRKGRESIRDSSRTSDSRLGVENSRKIKLSRSAKNLLTERRARQSEIEVQLGRGRLPRCLAGSMTLKLSKPSCR